MNKFEIQADVEFTVMADTEHQAMEIADDKLAVIPKHLQVTGVSVRNVIE